MSSSRSPTNASLSILGGGQLSQMLAFAAQSHAIHARTFIKSRDEPATHSPAECILDENEETLKNFLSSSSHLSFENEFIDIKQIHRLLSSDKHTRPIIFPSLDAMETLQDKLGQKKLLERLQIPTAQYETLPAEQDASDWLTNLEKTFGTSFVLKWSKYGYDGKGTFFYSGPASRRNATAFIDTGLKKDAQIFAEEKIAFTHEVAMTAARSVNGKILFFPLVLSEQKSGICSSVRGPALAFGTHAKLSSEAKTALQKILEGLNYCGVAATEFFITQDLRLFVNEIAPRVHNSSHYSQDACSCSQFEAHVLAPLNRLPKALSSEPFFGMINILGPRLNTYKRKCPELIVPLPQEKNLFFHWYGKIEIKEGRKLGHINYHAKTREDFNELHLYAKKFEEKILVKLQQESKESK